jgi:hypothetical protein
MLRRLGPLAVTIGSILGGGAASAQAPGLPAASAPMAGGTHSAAPGGLLYDRGNFNALDVYDQMRSQSRLLPASAPGEKPSDMYLGGGSAAPAAGSAGCNDCGPGGGLRGGRGMGGNGDNGPDFQCANTWRWTNFEHKLFLNYHYLTPLRTATKTAYGKANGATLGVEWLPWVVRDDERHFTRWGWITAFDYNAYTGERDDILRSELSGNILSSGGGNSWGFLLGPVWRSDFFLFGHFRMSPSLAAGVNFDWTTMRQAAPPVIPPAPIVRPDPQPTFTPGDTVFIRDIQKFKYTDFSIGGYARVLFDFPIRQNLNVGVGMDMRVVPTTTFVRNDEAKKFFGLILQITGEW